jgi:hypothetical protein
MGKKILIFLLLALGLGLWFYLKPDNSKKKPVEIPFLKRPDSYFVRPIKTPSSSGNSLQEKANMPSLHEGVAAWVGSYRVELAVYGINGSKANYGLYIDNSMAQPISPKQSEIYLKIDDQLLKMSSIKNGLFVTLGPLPTLPKKVTVIGKFNNKKFTVNFDVIKFRSQKINNFNP